MNNYPMTGIMYDPPFPETEDGRIIVGMSPGTYYSDDAQEAMDRTNADVLVSLGADEVRLNEVINGQLFQGWYYEISCDDPVTHDAMVEAHDRLTDYPLLDEDAYSLLEWQHGLDLLEMYLQAELRVIDPDDPYWNDERCTKVEENLSAAMHDIMESVDYYEGWTGNYSPNIPLLDILKSSEWAD